MKKVLATILSVVLLLTIIPMAYAEESNTYKVGDIIQFGSYPQSEVKDETLIAELNALAPEWDEWTSYGYYSGNGEVGSMVQGDWMKYIDIIYNGDKYRAVKFTMYRPSVTKYASSVVDSNQDDNGYNNDLIYWFLFEPINWRVLDPNTGLVLCETIIDSQAFCDSVYYKSNINPSKYQTYNDLSYTNYASNYESSSIRQWLNSNFFNTAFTENQKNSISETKLNNNGYYTSISELGYESLDSAETCDKIFLLSYNEIGKDSFGFKSNVGASDVSRVAYGSDYSKSQGLYVESDGNSYWLLRTAGESSAVCCRVAPRGFGTYYGAVDASLSGIRPAMRLTKCQHYYELVITPPTCTERGYTTYTCECGDTYIDNYVDIIDHNYLKGNCEEYEYAVCSMCGERSLNNYMPTEHNLVEFGRDEAIDCGGGWIFYKCNNCRSTISVYYEDDSFEHNWIEMGREEPTNCFENGHIIYGCEVCFGTKSEDIDALPHSFTNYISDGKATCTTDGLKIAKCDYCDATDSIPEKGGHTFSDKWSIDVEPTCTAEGSKSHHCENCSEKADVTPIDKLAHTYNKVTIEPNCTEKGYNIYTCVCGDTYTEIIEATGHDFDGSKCKNCDFDKASDCSCNCHKGGFVGFIWKIINFFQKLFKSNQVCKCGVKHY